MHLDRECDFRAGKCEQYRHHQDVSRFALPVSANAAENHGKSDYSYHRRVRERVEEILRGRGGEKDRERENERRREISRPGRISKADTAFAGKLQYNARPLRKAEFITARLHA